MTTIRKTTKPDMPSCIVCTARQSISLRGSSMYSFSMTTKHRAIAGAFSLGRDGV